MKLTSALWPWLWQRAFRNRLKMVWLLVEQSRCFMRRQRPTILLISRRACLGLGRKALRRIRVTSAAQMDAPELEKQITQDKEAGFTPFCVVATAGTTNSGAIDDLVKLAEIC